MHFLLQRISFTRIQLNPLVKSEPRQLRRKNDTAGGGGIRKGYNPSYREWVV